MYNLQCVRMFHTLDQVEKIHRIFKKSGSMEEVEPIKSWNFYSIKLE